MDQRLNWSLVFLVFILASHITDVFARHHHIKLRHARHRRQHGESYLPASFVLDTDEEESGTWGPWSAPSSCSRSCGGGVAHQTRTCRDIDESTQSEFCTGARKRFFSCNVQECPEPTQDFRAEQCAEFNNVPIEGVYYDWIPYTGGPNKCELNCMPRGQRFFYRHRLSVTDGTLCTVEKNDVCVQGKCRPVGCDMMLGSDAKEDRCRECGGDGSACNTVQGLLDMDDLQVGYNDILLIPEGATNIAISEVRPSSNYLAIRNASNHYYLNGNWRIDFPRSLRFAGSVFHYERRPKEFSAADIINALGPTSEAIYIVLLYQDTNVGVNYEYSIPQRFAKQSKPDSYTWVVEEFSNCSVECGGGIQSRLVRCVKRGDNEEADASLCDQQLEPDSTQACNVEPCPPEWVVKGWGPCSKQCGPGGEQSRKIQCEQVISGGIASLVDDHQCLDSIGPKDIQIQECNRNVECPQWHIGPWKPCNRLCGIGKQTRKITCYKKEEGKIFVLDDSACEDERPESDKPCELRPCAGVDWVVSKWSGCDNNCGLTQETRTTSCVTLDGDVYPDSQCNAETKPKLVRECSAQEKCAFQWYTTQWSECSVECGTGIQTRKVFCGTSPSGNEGIKEVDEGKCDPAKKYNTTKDCIAEIEECKGEWFTGPWTECSKPCGGGEMTRKVICMKDNKVVPIKGNCYNDDIMFSIEDCNKEACNEDETIPLEPGDINAPKEDDEEECEDYQDDAFEPVDSNLDVVDPESDYQRDAGALPLSFSSGGKLPDYGLGELMLGDDPGIEVDGDTESSGDDYSSLDVDYVEGSGAESTSDSSSSETPETDETSSTDITESTITDSTSSETSVTSESSTSPTSSSTKSQPTTRRPFPKIILEGVLPDPTTISSSGSTNSDSTESTSTSETSESSSTEETTAISPSSTISSSEETGATTDSESTSDTGSTESPETPVTEDTSSVSSSDTTVLSSSETPGLSSSDTTQSPSSDTTEQSSSGSTSSSSDTTVLSSSDATESSSSDTTVLLSSETPGSSSSDTTESSSSGTTQSSSSETPGSSSSDTTESSSSATTESPSSEITESSTSDITDTSSSDTTQSSDSTTTESSSSETSGSSSSAGTESSSSETSGGSSSVTTESSSSETSGSSSSAATESSSSETSGGSSSATTESSSSETSGLSSSDATESSSSETSGSSSSATSESSSSETPESSSSDATESSSFETSESSSSAATESSSSETSESSSSVATESSSSETSGASSSATTESSSSETLESSSSVTTEPSSSETLGSSSSTTTESSSSAITESSSSETLESSSSVTTESSSSETLESSSSVTTESSSSETSESSSSVTTESSSSETPESSSSDTTESSSSGTTQFSSSETPGSSTSDTTESPSSETPGSSSSDTTEASSSETPSSTISDTTELSSSETPGLSSSDTTESSSSDTTLSSSSETLGSSSSGSTELSSSETTESSSSETTIISSSETTESSISTETTELSSSETTESSSSETTVLSSSEATTSESSSASTETTESSLSTDITEETSESESTTDITTESDTTGETTESGITETDEDLDTTEQSHITDLWTTTSSTPTKRLRKCKPRKPKTCKSSPFGCCYDGVKAAKGPFGKGCLVPKTCKETEFGCCPDEVSPATGPDNQGCPDSHCSETLFGCCPDNVTPSEGNDYEGCPIPCDKSEFGCCSNGIEPASGPDGEGCGETETSTVSTSESEITSESSSTTVELTSTSEAEGTTTSEVESTTTSETEITTISGTEESCTNSPFGCCPDGVSPALGENGQGCHTTCEDSIFGCCDDGSTPAHGPNKEGCCLATPYGCCPDNIRHVQGPNLYGCGCQYSRYGCCPDNTTAGGPNNEGCACEHTPHGCCPNRIAAASGPDFEGCACHTYQFGCCPDGISIARGPQQLGCGCENSEFKCCSDGITPAKGENYAGCTCDSSKFGCCLDGDEEAQGENFEGCLTVPSNPGAACALERDRGTCTEFSVRWFFDTEYGGCSRFWYGGCEGNENRFKSQEECKEICVEPKGRDACFLPKISGPCEEYHPMWYYDSERKQCGQFVYKGCLGNANKFKTREECEGLCDIPDDIDPCEQEKEVGPCEGNFTRWYFNKETDNCEEFSYGGCKGNKNNFRTEISCHQRCLPAGRSRVQDMCALEKEPGPCPGSLLRWYYDSKRKSCRQFVFGGCKGNGNKFRTYAACEQRCPIRDSCSLPQEEGSCTEKHARWSFDQSKNRCMPFYYTGCGGNKNNYETRDACDIDCPPKIEQETCLLPAILGECYNYTKRWYYDSYEERCRQFYYGGCGGNGNNFETEDECTNRCRLLPTTQPPTTTTLATTTQPPAREFRTESCFLDQDFGPCDGDSVKWFYDSRNGICKQFRYGGCAGNDNKFDTPEECESRCGNVQDLCRLPAVVGPCRAAMPRYYYDGRTDSCYEFTYGGCQGNENNFWDKESCEQRCKQLSETTTKIVMGAPPPTASPPKSATCSLPRDPGPCNNDITAYFYDEQAGVCQAFLYGGCEGNANRFQTEEQCERLCGNFQGQDVCNIPSDPGPCLGAFRKFYYDPNTRRCHEFIYGGCDGNANRFTSTEECESVCVHREEPSVPGNGTTTSDLEICNEPVSVGSCSPGSFKRFYYSDERLNCIAFIYTGCGGNRNRFKNYDSCMKTCYSPINEVDVGPHGPELKDPCLAARLECNTIRCPYGTEDHVDDQNCQRCRCADPCRTESCPEGSKCAINLVAQGDFVGYQSVCRAILKPGNCPKVSNASRCEQECTSDADCTDDLKCCASGCGTSCLSPAPTEPITTTTPEVGITVPYPGAEPAAIQQPEEPNIRAEEGGYVVLPCACTGNPRPTITWRRGVTLIDNSLDRHSIGVEGSLQIVNLYTTDAGIYTCTADNHLAVPVRIQYDLYITEAQERSPIILGEPDYRVTVTLNSPAILPCNAIGWPRPQVTWWYEERMLPISRGLYALQRDNSLRIHRVDLSNLGVYTCQAFNGISRAMSWSVTLQAPGPVYNLSPENQKYTRYLIEPQQRPVTSTVRPQYPHKPDITQAPEIRTYAPFIPDRRPYIPPVVTLPPPEIVPGPRIVPVRVSVSADKGPFPERSEFNVSCNVDGFPIPRVVWSKDDVPIQPNNRITILQDNTLLVSDADKSDSGKYRCQAGNEYSSAEDSVDIQVAGIYIHPNCKDTQFYARCDLIVKANFCQHKYYARFCCRSCTEAGQLPVRGPHINETRRKRRSIFSFL